MNWLRDIIRKWLGISADLGYLEELYRIKSIESAQLRTELDALKAEIAQLSIKQPPQNVSLRINIDDYEASQLKALDQFKEGND